MDAGTRKSKIFNHKSVSLMIPFSLGKEKSQLSEVGFSESTGRFRYCWRICAAAGSSGRTFRGDAGRKRNAVSARLGAVPRHRHRADFSCRRIAWKVSVHVAFARNRDRRLVRLNRLEIPALAFSGISSVCCGVTLRFSFGKGLWDDRNCPIFCHPGRKGW